MHTHTDINTHIVETSYYRDLIFYPKCKMGAGDVFVEDELSSAIAQSVERRGLKEGHE